MLRRPPAAVFAILAALLAAGLTGPTWASGAEFRHKLADFSGAVPLSQPHLVVDDHHREVYTVFANEIRVFNDTGMEVFRFDAAPALDFVVDLAVQRDGDMLVLSHEAPGSREWFVTRCDYRGRPLGRMEFRDWPTDEDAVVPDLLFVRADRLVLASLRHLSVIETTLDGSVVRVRDLGLLLGITEEDFATVQVGDLDIDEAGNLAVTIPVWFRVAVISPEGGVRQFGRAGSGAGNFGNIAGIAARDGRLYVADRLRQVVIVVDVETLQFVHEFGRSGGREQQLVGPSGVVVDADGDVYVAQRAGRGVSVFRARSD